VNFLLRDLTDIQSEQLCAESTADEETALDDGGRTQGVSTFEAFALGNADKPAGRWRIKGSGQVVARGCAVSSAVRCAVSVGLRLSRKTIL